VSRSVPSRPALPLRDAFAVLFFVSVGMLLDPGYLVREPAAVVLITLLVVGAKSLTAFLIVALLRQPVRVAVTAAAALSQVGEFTIILATLGVSLGLLPAAALQLLVASALISITLDPALFRLIPVAEAWLLARPTILPRLERPADPA
jgi:monovalent cation:H+ antiporter-2, CPA2 family